MQGRNTVGVGIIGSGLRGVSCLAAAMAATWEETRFEVRCLMDRNEERLQEAQRHLKSVCAKHGAPQPDVRLTTDAQSLIDDPRVQMILVTTPTYAHREPAEAALASGKKVYLDKPIAADLEDAAAIVDAEKRAGHPLIMGFTRRYEEPWRRAFHLLETGVIGDLHMLQLRAVIFYHVYFHNWFRRREWSGGALNDKSAHHCDVLNWFAQSACRRVAAFGGQRVYKPDPNAPVRCAECDRDCPYRANPRTFDSHPKGQPDSWGHETEELYRGDNCVYLPGSDSLDHVTAILEYENGVKASLFWSVFGPPAPDEETLELVGSKGRLILYRRTGTLDLVTDYGKRKETIDCRTEDFQTSHFGADRSLIRDMRRFYEGGEPPVRATDGYESLRMVRAMQESVANDGALVSLADSHL
ncbi:Gfo/Idh/MocA family oxidoreductase [bacterium]|nr:Gfo/Idh/MocA family oxidoreductase [bacterium]